MDHDPGSSPSPSPADLSLAPRERPLRAFVGTVEVSGFTYELADGLARLGHEVTAGVRAGHTNFADRLYDCDLADDAAVDWGALSREVRDGALHVPEALPEGASVTERMRWILARHDLFVFVYGSLWADRARGPIKGHGIGREYALLRRLGKRVVAYFVGPDVRHATAYDQQLARLGGAFRRLGEIVPSWGDDPLSRPLRNLRRAERYADAIFSQPNQSGLALRPYAHIHAPVDLARFAPRVPGREVPVVVHAPSEKTIKGTGEIVAALDRLRAEGVRFELRLLHDVPNGEVLAALSEADVVIDQLHLPMHGRLGVEAMASGCALATADRADLEPVPARRPLWPLDPARLDAQLRALFTDRALRVRLAREGVEHARRHHDHVAVARRVVECATRPDARLEHEPEFFARHYRLPEGATVPERLRRMTAHVARRWGLPEGVTVGDLRARGLA